MLCHAVLFCVTSCDLDMSCPVSRYVVVVCHAMSCYVMSSVLCSVLCVYEYAWARDVVNNKEKQETHVSPACNHSCQHVPPSAHDQRAPTGPTPEKTMAENQGVIA